MGQVTPSVSVIIPAFNRRATLPRALDSAIRQTYPAHEIIVIDDGSADGTSEWLASAYPQIMLTSLATNCGAAVARNRGIARARGDFVAFLDSDDEWHPEFLSRHLAFHAGAPDHVLSFCDAVHRRLDGSEFRRTLNPRELRCLATESATIDHLLLHGTIIFSLSYVVVRKSALDRAGGFNEALRQCEDRELYLRLRSLGGFGYIPEPLAIRHIRPDSLTRDFRSWAHFEDKAMDVFFARPESRRFRHLEERARYNFLRNIAEYAEDDDPALSADLKRRLWLRYPLLALAERMFPPRDKRKHRDRIERKR
jgi:glycosyltransferase involved in cell wall biosynthesis